jgi:hypothetical protein
MSVNTIAGLPVFEVFADYHIVAGRYNQNDFYLDTNGNLGLGTGSPASKLDVVGDEADIYLRSADYDLVRIINRGTGSNLDKGLISVFDTGVEDVRIDSAGNSWFDGGAVGIGTTNPALTLHVNNAGGSNNSRFSRGGSYIFDLKIDNVITNSAIDYIIEPAQASSGILFRSRNSSNTNVNALAINRDGNVGIGTTNPATNLYVGSGTQSIANLAGIAIGNGASSYSYFSASDQTKQFIAGVDHSITYTKSGTVSNHDHSIITNNTNRVYIEAGGNVGIGINSPGAPLHVYQAAKTAIPLRLHNYHSDISNDGTTTNFIDFYSTDDNATFNPQVRIGSVIQDQAGDSGIPSEGHGNFVVYTGMGTDSSGNGTLSEWFRVNHDGNVGINTATPTEKLHVIGNGLFSGQLRVYGSTSVSGSVYGAFLGSYSGGTSISPGELVLATQGKTGWGPGDELGRIRFYLGDPSGVGARDVAKIVAVNEDGDGSTTTTGSGALAFYTSAYNSTSLLERLRIDQSGKVGINTNNPTARLQINDDYTTSSYGGGDLYVKNSSTRSSYDPDVQNTTDLQALITVSSNNTTGPDKPGLILHNDDNTAGGFSPMLLFSKRETGSTDFKATMAGIYARSPLGTGDAASWIDGELIFATAGASSQGIKQRMVINKEGLVGIGTISPTSLLHLEKALTGDSSQLEITNGAGAAIKIGITGSGANENAHIKTHSGEDLEFQIGQAADSASPDVLFKSGGGVQFSVYGAGTFTGTATQRLAVDSSGNVIEIPIGAGAVDGAGTTGYISIWTDSDTIGNSVIYQENGNVGVGMTTAPSYKLQVNGSFAATTKSFVIDHPTKPNKKLRYASLEGPENGVYVRGKGDSNVIELPEYWTELVHEESITVNLTAIGRDSNKKIRAYSVDNIEDNKVYIYTDSSDNIYNYFFTVYGERKDVERLEVEVD